RGLRREAGRQALPFSRAPGANVVMETRREALSARGRWPRELERAGLACFRPDARAGPGGNIGRRGCVGTHPNASIRPGTVDSMSQGAANAFQGVLPWRGAICCRNSGAFFYD